MLVVCPDCVSSYRYDSAAVAAGSAASFCAHCRRPLRDAQAPTFKAPTTPARESSAMPGLLAVVAVLATASGLLCWREPIARAAPAAAAMFRLAGFGTAAAVPVVHDLTTRWDQDGLEIAGRLANPGSARLTLPSIRISVRDEAARTLYDWTTPPPQTTLEPGGSVSFTSRLDRPPSKGRDLAVGFDDDRVTLSEAVVKGER